MSRIVCRVKVWHQLKKLGRREDGEDMTASTRFLTQILKLDLAWTGMAASHRRRDSTTRRSRIADHNDGWKISHIFEYIHVLVLVLVHAEVTDYEVHVLLNGGEALLVFALIDKIKPPTLPLVR